MTRVYTSTYISWSRKFHWILFFRSSFYSSCVTHKTSRTLMLQNRENSKVLETRHKNRPKELNVINKNDEYETDSMSSGTSISPTSYPRRTSRKSMKPSKYPTGWPTLRSTNEQSLKVPTQAPLPPKSDNSDDTDNTDNTDKSDNNSSNKAGSCKMRNDGTFGIKTPNKVESRYIYKLILISNTSTEEINNDIIPELENTISNNFLTTNFVQCRVSRQINSQQFVITGISSSPKDTFMEDLSCDSTSSNMCIYVDGGMTFYLAMPQTGFPSTMQKDSLKTSMQQFTTSLVKQNMQSNSLFNTHENIIGVTYMKDYNDDSSITGIDSINSDLSRSDPVIAFPIAVGLAIFVIVTLLRKNRGLELNQNMYRYE